MTTNDRTKARAEARLAATAEKCKSICKMLERAERERDREIVRASKAGVSDTDMARIVGLSRARVGQLRQEQGDDPKWHRTPSEEVEPAKPARKPRSTPLRANNR